MVPEKRQGEVRVELNTTLKRLAELASMQSATRDLHGSVNAVFKVVACGMPIFMFYLAGPPFLGRPGMGLSRGIFLILICIMVFLKYPAFGKRALAPTVPWYDWLFIAFSFITFGYWTVKFDEIVLRIGNPTDSDIVASVIAVVICIEITRRILGPVLARLGILTVLYGLFGDKLPFTLFSHTGFSFATVASYTYSMSGIFGFLLRITMLYVVLFVLFGALLRAFGASSLFVEFPYAVMGRLKGGPGLAAVGASTLFGMVSGSAAANTAATGTFTIPLMKRAGYPPHVAGAIEPAASTGGMFMPPVMGAGAFIMAEITNIPYLHIIAVGLAPALIYFTSVAMVCYTEAGRRHLRPLPASELPPVGPILRKSWYHVVPIIVLVYLLVAQYTPPMAAFGGIVIAFLVNVLARFITKEQGTRYTEVIKDIVESLKRGLQEGSEGSLMVACLAGQIGIIVGIVLLTGVGFMFTSSLMELTHGVILRGILVALFASYILGMGMPVTSVYVLLAVLIAPALHKLGMGLLAAHFLLFWFSQSSNISPPVAIAAYVGAGIAQADPVKTAFTAFRYAAFLFILPLLFVYSPLLMPEGVTLEVLRIILMCFLATIPFAGLVSGYFRRRCYIWERLLMGVCLAFLLIPQAATAVVGSALLAIILLLQLKGPARKECSPAQ